MNLDGVAFSYAEGDLTFILYHSILPFMNKRLNEDNRVVIHMHPFCTILVRTTNMTLTISPVNVERGVL